MTLRNFHLFNFTSSFRFFIFFFFVFLYSAHASLTAVAAAAANADASLASHYSNNAEYVALDNNRQLHINTDSDPIRELFHKKASRQKSAPAPSVPQIPRASPEIVRPVRVDSVHSASQQQLSCPHGSILVNDRCVFSEVVPAAFVCGPGSVVSNGQCAVFTKGQKSCPDGFRLNNGRCTVADIVSAELMCEEGELSADGSSCRVVGEQYPHCPQGFSTGPDGLCVQKFSPSKSCPEGYTADHALAHGCVAERTAEASPVCPSGSQIDSDGKKCFTMQNRKAVCQKGFRISHDGTRCLHRVKKVLAACPEGFHESGHFRAVCERVIEVPPQLTCPAEFSLDPLSGRCEMRGEESVSCPESFVRSHTNPQLCERVVESEGSCPPGTVSVGFGQGLVCRSSVEHEIIECCPPGFELVNGGCERTEYMRSNSRKCRGECEVVRAVAPEFFCLDEFSLVDNRCVRQLSRPCGLDSRSVPAECEPFLPGSSLRPAVAGVADDQMPSSCVPLVKAQDEVCTFEESVSADFTCPADSQYEDGKCVVRERLVEEAFCNVGVFDPMTNRCVKDTRVPIKTECPAGTTRVGRRCVSYESHEASFSCSPDTVPGPNGACFVRVRPLVSAGEVTVSAPMQVCPTGTLQGSLCYDVERIPRQLVCPMKSIPASKHLRELDAAAESDYGSYCVEVSDFTLASPKKKYVKPRFYCADGGLAKGKHCHNTRKADYELSCPPGSSLLNDLCIRTVQPVMMGGRVRSVVPAAFCPPGSVVQGKQCAVVREAEVSVVCPPGFYFQANSYLEKECVRYSQKVAVCPAGSVQSVDGCISSRSVALEVHSTRSCAEEEEEEEACRR